MILVSVVLFWACCSTCFAFAGTARELHGTVWKIMSWATDDEHVGFYDGCVYYITGDDYIGVYLLEDSFYREYEHFGFGAGVLPERLVNYPGDVVFWGVVFPAAGIGTGMALPLAVPACLVLKTTGWVPY